MRFSGRVPRAGLAVCGVVGLVATALGMQAAVAVDLTCDPPSPREQQAKPTKVVAGKSPQGGPERTEYFGETAYRVTRCDENGQLVLSQTNALIKVPGGRREFLPVVLARPEPERPTIIAVSYGLWGDPKDPKWAEQWREHGAEVRSKVLPPTDEAEAADEPAASGPVPAAGLPSMPEGR